uniref:Uncharacterized protein n=1 Tax=Marmota marmota marmota TaxID=9994 RepID=A0A8C5YKI7_MARMA
MHLKMRCQRKLNSRISFSTFESAWITHICLKAKQCPFSPHYFSIVLYTIFNNSTSVTKIIAEFFKRTTCIYCVYFHFLYIIGF